MFLESFEEVHIVVCAVGVNDERGLRLPQNASKSSYEGKRRCITGVCEVLMTELREWMNWTMSSGMRVLGLSRHCRHWRVL